MTDWAPQLERVFGIEAEEGTRRLAVTGKLPERLVGRYHLNGPARFRRGALAYHHWLDGDGLVTQLRFEGGAVTATHRFVGSTKHREEEAADRPIYRCFGTAFPGDRMRRGASLESPANVSVYPWSDRLLAFGEQGLPWHLDPETLETRGEERFAGRLNEASPLSAHPCFDRTRGEMVNFGISYSATNPALYLYRFRDGALFDRRRVPLPYPCSVHDFGLSASYAVFYLSPYLLDMGGLLEAGRSVMDCLSWQPERGSYLLVVDREDARLVASLPLEGRYCLHLANCFEEDGRLVVDLVELDRPVYDQYQVIPDLFTDVAPGRPVRFVLETSPWRVAERQALDYGFTPDFPAIDLAQLMRPAEDCWVLGISKSGLPGRKFFDELARIHWPSGGARGRYQAPAGCYLGGEPVFLGDPDRPGRGWVLCQQIDPRGPSTEFLLFDAHAIDQGPVAHLPLASPIPPGFHASWQAG